MMKRGLSTRDVAHTTDDLLRDRQRPIREALERRGLDAAVISSDISTGGDIAYLTHLTLYWSTSLLVIGADGATIFLPGLSPRTENWFGETGLFDEVRSGTDQVGALADLAAAHGYRRLGLVDRERFPQELLRALETDPRYETEDIGAIVREARVVPDEPALADLRAASDLITGALERLADELDGGASPCAAAADAEFVIRSGGAWDASVASAPAGEAVGVRIRAQLRDAWVAAETVVGQAPGVRALSIELRDWALRRVTAGARRDDLRSAFDALLTARPELARATWELVVEPACDIEARPEISSPSAIEEGAAVHVCAAVWGERGEYLALWGNTVLISGVGQAQPLISER